jgi:heme oxygenase
VSREHYRLLLGNLYFVYKAMEEQADANQADAVYGPLHSPSELARVPGLEEDLVHYYGGESWRDAIVPSPATTEYIER